MNCKHREGASCTLGLFGGTPSDGVCSVCDRYDGPARGAGDVVHSIAKWTGIETMVRKVAGGDCGCAGRRAALNKALPMSDSEKEQRNV